MAQPKRVTVGEDADISRRDPHRVNGVGNRCPRGGNGNSLLVEGVCNRRPASRRLDGCGHLWAGRSHRVTVGQGHGRRTRLRRFGLVRRRLFIVLLVVLLVLFVVMVLVILVVVRFL